MGEEGAALCINWLEDIINYCDIVGYAKPFVNVCFCVCLSVITAANCLID